MANETRVTGAPASTKVITGKARLSYANLWEPRAIDQTKPDDKKYSCTLIIPKTDTDTIKAISAAIQAAAALGLASKWAGKAPAELVHTMYDGDGPKGEGKEELKGCYFLRANCNANTPPQIVDANRRPITNQADVYSGCYGRASVNFYPYNFNGKKGIACGLGNIQKLEDGEPFSARSNADDDFGDTGTPSDFIL